MNDEYTTITIHTDVPNPSDQRRARRVRADGVAGTAREATCTTTDITTLQSTIGEATAAAATGHDAAPSEWRSSPCSTSGRCTATN